MSCTYPILVNVTTVSDGTEKAGPNPGSTFQASVDGTGAVTATVVVDVSNDGSHWEIAGTITLSGTTSDSDGFAMSALWSYCRGRVTAISGTGASVNLNMSA